MWCVWMEDRGSAANTPKLLRLKLWGKKTPTFQHPGEYPEFRQRTCIVMAGRPLKLGMWRMGKTRGKVPLGKTHMREGRPHVVTQVMDWQLMAHWPNHTPVTGHCLSGPSAQCQKSSAST